jgi:ABC-type transport system involved in Fe-S cluster assembly fused permease/ATPase subunit
LTQTNHGKLLNLYWQNSRWKLNPKSKNIQTDASCTKLIVELCYILIILTKLVELCYILIILTKLVELCYILIILTKLVELCYILIILTKLSHL